MRAIRAFIDNDSGFAEYGPAYLGHYGPSEIRVQSRKIPEGKYVLFRDPIGRMCILYQKFGTKSNILVALHKNKTHLFQWT